MGRSSRLTRRRTTIEPWPIVLLLAGAMLFATLALGGAPSRELHEAVLTSLRAIDTDHASLQRDVLQARAGLLLNYDPLVKSVSQLRASVARLQDLFDRSDVGEAVKLKDDLKALAASIDDDEDLAERFKTNNALLQNSLSVAVQFLDAFDHSDDRGVKQAVAASGDLSVLLIRYLQQPDERLDKLIRLQLRVMEQAGAEDAAQVRSFADHVRTVLTTLPQVDGTIEAVQSSDSSRRAQLLQRHYLDAFGVISARAGWTRALFGTVSVLLCGCVALLLYRLRIQTRRLTRQLDFGNVTAEVRRRLSEGGEDREAVFGHAVGQFAAFFESDVHALAILNRETFSVEQAYGTAALDVLGKIGRAFGPRFAAAAGSPDYLGFALDDMDPPEGPPMRTAASRGYLVMGWFGERAVSLFLMERHPGCRDVDHEERLLGDAALIMVRGLMTHLTREENRLLEARLEHAQRLEAVGTLAGGIAHEFNNSLAAILGYAEMALQLKGVSGSNRHYLGEIVAAAQRAKHVTDQILTFGRKRERLARPFDMGEAVADILPLLKLSLPEGICLEIEAEQSLPAVLGNPIEIQQVVMNLSANAAHASRNGGAIRIVLKTTEVVSALRLSHGELPAGRYVLLAVDDEGEGISSAVLAHIFEPFFTTRANNGGTGLGLAAVHGIAAAMAGRIDVRSREGQGTRFDLYFPALASSRAVPLAEFFNERETPLGQGETVLLAVAEIGRRFQQEERIAALGYEPVGVAGLDGLREWMATSSVRPDLIVLDVATQDEAGQISSVMKDLAGIPALLLVEAGEVPRAVKQAFGDWLLRKPVSTSSLALALSRLARAKEREPV